jgi:hypothetical protein
MLAVGARSDSPDFALDFEITAGSEAAGNAGVGHPPESAGEQATGRPRNQEDDDEGWVTDDGDT